MAKKKHYTEATISKKKKNSYHKHRNPSITPSGFGRDTAMAVMGGLLGVTATKMVTGMVTNMVPAANNGIMRVVASGVAAFLAGKAGKMLNPAFGSAMQFGGLMQTGSEALNVIAPSLGSTLSLRGLGAFMPASFPVPQNSIEAGMVPVPSAVTVAKGVSGRFN